MLNKLFSAVPLLDAAATPLILAAATPLILAAAHVSLVMTRIPYYDTVPCLQSCARLAGAVPHQPHVIADSCPTCPRIMHLHGR